MKYLLFLILIMPLRLLAQKKTGYGFAGIGLHLINKGVEPAGRFAIGILPTKNAGIGADLQYIKDFGFDALADFRFFSDPIKASTLTLSIKAGGTFNRINGTPVNGFTYGAEGGLIFGKVYFSLQYLSIGQNFTNANFNQRVNDAGFSLGVKF